MLGQELLVWGGFEADPVPLCGTDAEFCGELPAVKPQGPSECPHPVSRVRSGELTHALRAVQRNGADLTKQAFLMRGKFLNS